MRAVIAMGLVLGIAAPITASAAPDARFLGKRPHGPLATIVKAKVSKPGHGACRTWAKKGSTWKALDAFGRVVGKAKVTALDRYDVTNCDELSLATVSGDGGVGLYVSGTYAPLAIQPWSIPRRARAELETWIEKRDKALPVARSQELDLALVRRLLAWQMPNGETLVVVGGRGLSVMSWTKTNGWRLVHQLPPVEPDELEFADTFQPVGVLDMNADGRVEIVVHQRYIDAYEDFTLTPDGETYRRVEAGISGAFA